MIAAHAKFDGKTLLRTSDLTLDAADIARGSKALQDVELTHPGTFLWMSSGLELGEVLVERGVDLSEDVALEAAHGLAFGLAFGDAPLHVVLGRVAVAESGDHDHVQRPVRAAIAAWVEPMALGLAR